MGTLRSRSLFSTVVWLTPRFSPTRAMEPAEVIEVDGVVDLLGREAAAAHWYLVAVEDVADRPPFDAEPVAEFVHPVAPAW